MPLRLVCETCDYKFMTRKRGNRIIRFCSQECSNALLNEQKRKYWEEYREKRDKEPYESVIETIKPRFEENFEKIDGCWIWKGARKGPKRLEYGAFNARGKSTTAHRFSWYIYKGIIPEGMLVLHKCDVPLCVNPEHLFLGTHLDNERDKIKKGRGKVEKLNIERAKEIKNLIAAGMPDMKIARKYGISYQTVWAIKIGRTWKDII